MELAGGTQLPWKDDGSTKSSIRPASKVLRKPLSPSDTGAHTEWELSYYLLTEEVEDLAGRMRACKLDTFPEGHGKGLVWWTL